MTDVDTSVLIISDDHVLIDSLGRNKKVGHELNVQDSAQNVLDDPQRFEEHSITIFDVSNHDNDLPTATSQALELKKVLPTQAMILVGEPELLGDVLKSAVHSQVFRAFPKPVNPSQIALAYSSGAALHENLMAREAAGEDLLSPAANDDKQAKANTRSNSSAIFAALGVVALAVIGWLIFGSQDENTPAIVSETPSPNLQVDDPVVTISDTAERIQMLNAEAQTALYENRIITPDGDNALEYFNQVLALDAYDTQAYEGKKEVASRLRQSYQELVNGAEFDQALSVINVLQEIDPLNPGNDELRRNLQASIDNHVAQIKNSGTSQQIEQTAEVLQRIESEFEGSRTASDALKAEQKLVKQIDQALQQDVLVPPTQNNAYGLVSEALKRNSVSRANLEPRVASLSNKLLALAEQNLSQDNFDEVDKLSALVRRLNANEPALVSLGERTTSRKLELAQSQQALLAKQNAPANDISARPEPAEIEKILPPEFIKRVPPRYPNRALNKNIEGWVEVTFRVNSDGRTTDIGVINAEPAGMFETAATRAVKKWRFQPAKNSVTGESVESDELSTKLQFRLN